MYLRNATKEQLREIRKHLMSLALKKTMPRETASGICSEMWTMFKVGSGEWHKAFEVWPEFSGDESYPIFIEGIPMSSEWDVTEREGQLCTDGEELYDYVMEKWGENPLGDARRRLCIHMVNWITATYKGL